MKKCTVSICTILIIIFLVLTLTIVLLNKDVVITLLRNNDIICSAVLILILILPNITPIKSWMSKNIKDNQGYIFLYAILVFFCGISFIIISSVLINHPVREAIYAGLGSVLIFSIAFSIHSELTTGKKILDNVTDLIDSRLNLYKISKKYSFGRL